MSWKYAFFILLIASFVINCSKTKELTELPSKVLRPSEISAFHADMHIKVGWIPYEGQKLVRTGKNEWKVVPHQDDDRVGSVPTMLITYPVSGDSIMLNMNIKNELLGKLIKHSAMTQEPIKRPFTQFFEDAKCQSCHPEDVKVDFGTLDHTDNKSEGITLVNGQSGVTRRK